MPDILERLIQDMKEAMKSRDKFTLSVIRMLRSELKYAEIAAGSSLTGEQIIDVLSREYKKRKDAAADFAAAGREDLVLNLVREQDIIKQYLPEPLSEEEVRAIILEAIETSGAQTKADFGKVMATVMPMVKGRCDGSLVSGLVKQMLDK